MSLLKRLGGESAPPPPAVPAQAPAPSIGQPAGPVPGIVTVTSSPPAADETMVEMSLQITDRLLASLGATQIDRTPESERMLKERFANYYRQIGGSLSESQIAQLYAMVLDEIFGFGPIQRLLDDDSVTEVMVNGPNHVYVERKGQPQIADVKFLNDDHVLKVIDRIVRPLGRRVDRKWPMVDARLPDGSRVNAIIPPCSIDGPSVTIRKFGKKKLTVEDLIKFGSMTREMADFLQACVVSALNVVVSGGTGSGKTTLLNVLSTCIPSEDRIVTIEDSAELRLGQEHIVRLEAKPAEIDGSGRVTINDLVINSLRMRPDRIVVGEVRDGAAFAMLQAMNTGHDGSLTTLHANSPREAVSRMETMCMMAGMDMPVDVIRAQIAGAIHLIVQQTRLPDGQRKVSSITEVQGLESGTVVLQEIFALDVKGKTQDGKYVTELKPTGVRPRFTPKLEANGFKLPPSIFGAVAPGRR